MDRTTSPRNDDEGIEQLIKAKGLTAPRVTRESIEGEIESEEYFTAAEGVSGSRYMIHDPNVRGPLSMLTFCVLVLKNGFTVVGTSACASPENFDSEVGRRIARENAVQQVWPLLGFRLKDQLAQEKAGLTD